MNKRYFIAIVVALVGLIAWRVYVFREAKALLPDRKVLIEASLEQRINKYTAILRNKCEKKALEAAKLMADSIVFDRANELMLFDTITRPLKPQKPLLPERKKPKDSLEIAPLVKQPNR